jgi:hypothetical protein
VRGFFRAYSTIQEYSKRRWPVNVGDTILFAYGSGDELQFLGTSNIIDCKVEVQEQQTINEETERLYLTKLQLDKFDSLPEDRTLGAFMFSLVRVSNFSKPFLNFRHLGRIEEEDLKTLITGTVNVRRSLYFGLLRHIPSNWRAYLEYSSMAEKSAKEQGIKNDIFPTDELLGFLNKLVFQPLEIGSETEPVFRESLARMGLENTRVEARMPDYNNEMDLERESRGDKWSISELISQAPDLLQEIKPNWNMINEMLQNDTEENSNNRRGENKKWRPHKW